MRSLVALMLSFLVSSAGAFDPSTQGKKLISYGADWPNTAYLKAHIAEMEQHPFDGIVVGVSESREPKLNDTTVGCMIWGKSTFAPEIYDRAIADLKATKFNKFTDNFIQIEAMPGNVDFFDPAYESIFQNIKAIARVAKQGGCVGIEFDPEEYGDQHMWTYTSWPEAKQKTHTEAEYIEKARERGEQFMRAINSEFPKVKILMLFGPSISQINMAGPHHGYRLLAAFIEGMCRGADSGSQVIDGYEISYGYRAPTSFEEGRKTMDESRKLFEDKAAFDRVMQKGFGLWTDNNSHPPNGWHPNEPEKNHFTPQTYQTATFDALSYSDEYVWVWREAIHEWTGEGFAPAYDQAMREGRIAPGKTEVGQHDLTEAEKKRIKPAAEQTGADDASTFGDLMQSRSIVLDFPADGWKFRIDPNNKGETEKWFELIGESKDWSPISIKKYWQEDGWDYQGNAWYHKIFTVDQIPAGKTLELVFGAVDESAFVWLNGQKIGEHDVGEGGWADRFTIPLTGKLKSGENDLAVRVLNRTGPGGIWKSVKIMAVK